MFCCGRPGTSKDPIVDIDALVRKDVQRTRGRPNFCERLTKKYELQVQWSYVKQSSSLHKFTLTRKQDASDKIQSRKMCLFKTEFTNKSGNTQKYTFKTERQTKSTVRASVQKSFSLGGSLNVPLGLPSVPAPGVEPLAITGGLTSTLSITKSDEKTFEENLLWSVDSSVEVKEHSKTIASLIIEEENASAEFEVKHVLDPKEMTIPVYLLEKGSGSYIHAFDYPSEKLYKLVSEQSQLRVKKLEGSMHGGIELITEGVCDVCYGAKQIITINEVPYLPTQESLIEDNMLPGPSGDKPLPVLSVLPVVPSKPAVVASQQAETSLTTTKLGSTPSDENLKKPLLQMKKMAVHT